MHEMSVCQALVTQVTAIAAAHPGGHIRGIHLHNGPCSGVDSSLLRHAFEFFQKGTIVADATLTIEDQPLTVRCRDCAHIGAVAVNDWRCPACSSLATEVAGGDTLILARLELDIP
ncbi:MAG: hydrogenase maturation nickel metallochaperone HypA [Magnetococcales bacterium]|nr:hydrogenase maturation nickel metallochaperone HypA [Magnetococcales bacterium]